MADLRRALVAEPRDAALWLKLSDVARTAGDVNLALEAATKAQELKPDDPEALYRLGYLLHQKGQTQKSIEQYRRYLRVAPDGSQKESIRQWLRTAGG